MVLIILFDIFQRLGIHGYHMDVPSEQGCFPRVFGPFGARA